MNTNVKIESLDYEGRGIAHLNGKVVFISNALINEDVDITISLSKKKYDVANVLKYNSVSDKRIKEKCPYFNICGGCNLMHMTYPNELIFKEDKLKSILSRYADIKEDIIVVKSPKELYYRNKIELKIKDNNWGYYNDSTHDFVSIDKCLLAKESINKIISDKKYFNFSNGEIIIRSNYNDEILIKVITDDKYDIDINKLKDNNKIVGIIVNDETIYGTDSFVEVIDNKYYNVNINSFFQINEDILKEVFKVISGVNYKNVVDLYCGVGTLGIAAQKDTLYGIEVVKEAVLNACTNAKINKQDNNFYLLGDSSKIKEIKNDIDTIIIDPPRSGINDSTMKNIIDILPKNIIYMSCNPMSLASNLVDLKKYYAIDKIYLFDMFPRTSHIECICVMKIRII